MTSLFLTRGVVMTSLFLTRGVVTTSLFLTRGVVMTSLFLTRGVVMTSLFLTRGVVMTSLFLTRGVVMTSLFLTRGVEMTSLFLTRGVVMTSLFPHSPDACPAGSYRSGEMTNCQLCDVNTVSEAVSEGAGATTCTACGPGTESNTEHTVCGKSGTRDLLIISYFNGEG